MIKLEFNIGKSKKLEKNLKYYFFIGFHFPKLFKPRILILS